MSFTGVPDGRQFPTGRWPDQLSFNRHLDTYRWTLGSSVQIQALDHVHIVNYDQDGAGPYTMTLTMPVMEHLPAGSRMYYFYVSRCHDGDFLNFSTVPLSGNTVNGVLGTYSFTLTGEKTLFACVGVNGNYIIHPINVSIPTPAPPPTYGLSGVYYDPPSPISCASVATPLGISNTCSFQSAAVMTAPKAINTNDYIGAFTENTPWSGGAYYGFLCNTPGFWSINLHIYAVCATASLTAPSVGGGILVLNPGGATLKHFYGGEQVTIGTSTGNPSYASLSQEVKCPLGVGDIVVPTSRWVPGAAITSSVFNEFRTSFIYLGDYPVVAPLMALRSESASSDPVPLAKNEIVIGGEFDSLKARKELEKKLLADQALETQKRKDQQLMYASSSSSSQQQVVSQQPSFTLADVESIVRKVMSSQQPQAMSVDIQEISSSSSAPPSAPSRKRSRASLAEEKEPA